MSTPTCKLCGEPLPAGEEMFYYHGFSGPCPKPPLATPAAPSEAVARGDAVTAPHQAATDREWISEHGYGIDRWTTPFLSFYFGRYWRIGYGIGPFYGSIGYVEMF